ncbi:MAG: CPBP family intramembrane glutamic endopeptidase [candidate division NC10 bacterium]
MSFTRAVYGRIVWMVVIVEGGLLGLAMGLGWWVGRPPFARISLEWQAIVLGIVATGPPLVGMWWGARSSWGPLRRLQQEVLEKIVPLFAECSSLELILVAVAAGLAEEALFRGVIQITLADWLGPFGALLVASALFGLGHPLTPTYAAIAALLGLYLGGLLMVSDNLLPAILVHAGYDLGALLYLIRIHYVRQQSLPTP